MFSQGNDFGTIPVELFSKALRANPDMTRRGFFSLTAVAGALTFLGGVTSPSGLVTCAYADEDDRIHFVVYVLGRDEVPVLCFDVSGEHKPVEGMMVTITSLDNKKQVSATTNADGFATVRIKALSQQADDDTASSYSFYGKVEASRDGYRSFCNPETYIASAGLPNDEGICSNAIEIPTHKIDSGDTYLRTAALDGADVQYCSASCGVGADDTTEHTFLVEVIAPANRKIEVSVVTVAPHTYKRVTWGHAVVSATEDDPTLYSASFTGAWLASAPEYGMLKVEFGRQGRTPQVMTSPIELLPNCSALAGSSLEMMVTPGAEPGSNANTCPIPAWFSSKGDTLNLALMFAPVQFFCDNKGNMGISVTLFKSAFVKMRDGKNALKPGDGSKFLFGGLSGKKAWKSYQDEVGKSIDRFDKAMDNAIANDRAFGRSPLSSKIDGTFEVTFLAYAAWKEKVSGVDRWSGDVALQFKLGVAVSLTQQYILIVPFFLTLEFNAMVQAKIALGILFDKGFKNVKWGHSIGRAPIAVTVVVHVEVALSLGVGIAGVASIGVRGSGFLRIEDTFDKVEGKEFPHSVVTIGAKAEAFVQAWFLKKTLLIAETPKGNVYDNWKSEDISLLLENAGISLLSAVEDGEDFVTVSQGELRFGAGYAA